MTHHPSPEFGVPYKSNLPIFFDVVPLQTPLTEANNQLTKLKEKIKDFIFVMSIYVKVTYKHIYF